MDPDRPTPEPAPQAALEGLRIDRRPLTQRGPGRRRAVAGFAVVAVVAGAGAFFGPETLRPAVQVQLARVGEVYPAQTFTLLTASGYVVPQRKAALGSKITSRLTQLGVAEGDRVLAGQVVARLENADLASARDRTRATVDVARADVSQAEAELQEATLAFQRTRDLLERKFVSRSEFDVAEARLKVAQAALATRRASLATSAASLREAEVQLDYSAIRAPFDAVVLTKNADVGDIVTPLGASANARASVVTIADTDSYQVEADVAESSIGQVRAGQPCEIQLDALPDVRLRCRVHMTVPTADRSKATVLVRAEFVDKDPRVLPEMSAKVAFLGREVAPDERAPVVAVPAAAVVDRAGQAIVLVVRDGRAVATPVRLGRSLGELREVLQGPSPGESVVVAPGDLTDGARVRAAGGP
jgi:RND family efflux transporter MFP subunit